MFFMLVPRTSPLSTLLVPVQFLLVPDNRTVLNVKPCVLKIAVNFFSVFSWFPVIAR